MKQLIREVIEARKEITLKELYTLFPEKKKEIIRSTLNLMVKNEIILRSKRGVYQTLCLN